MTLKEQLNNDLKTAMRSNDEVRRRTLRLLLAGLRQAELEQRTAAARQMNRAGELTEAQLASLETLTLSETESLAALQKEAKAHRESIADAAQAGRADLVAANEAELRIIEGYLPQQLTRDEIAALAEAAIAEAGVAGPTQIGAVMKILSPRTKGRADGRLVNEVVRELLAR